MNHISKNISELGMSLVGALVTLGLISIGALALMTVQEQFFKTTKTIEVKESVVQEGAAKAAILQNGDFLKLEEICKKYSKTAGTQPGDCLGNIESAHYFLYLWYQADPQTKMCIELTRCIKKAQGKIYEVTLTTHYDVNGKKLSTPIVFRKAK